MTHFIATFLACLLANFVYDFLTAQAIIATRKGKGNSGGVDD